MVKVSSRQCHSWCTDHGFPWVVNTQCFKYHNPTLWCRFCIKNVLSPSGWPRWHHQRYFLRRLKASSYIFHKKVKGCFMYKIVVLLNPDVHEIKCPFQSALKAKHQAGALRCFSLCLLLGVTLFLVVYCTSLNSNSLLCCRRRSIIFTATSLPLCFSVAIHTTPVEPSPIFTKFSR